MKQLRLSNADISALCLSMAQLYHAGIGTGDALALMAEDETDPAYGEMLLGMQERADQGRSLGEVFREAGCFPDYVSALLEVGEASGRSEESLFSLANYYENRARLDRRIRQSLLYPSVLFGVMLVVIVVLLVWVLPIFNDVYAQLGSSLTGIAGGLLAFGRGLRRAMPVLLVLLGVAVLFLAAFFSIAPFHDKVLGTWRRKRGDKGVNGKIALARFAQALSMGMSSGMDVKDALELSLSLTDGAAGLEAHCRDCIERLDRGETLAQAMSETGLLPKAECRLLDAGIRSGSGEAVMEKIARRLLEDSEATLEEKVGRVEPALVLITSVMVGLILLSVMLPLMDIMSAIG